jgi:hypothetical protein
MAERRQLKVVGRPLPRVDAAAKVTGVAVYADDLHLPRMLHCRILRSPHRTPASSAWTPPPQGESRV